MLCGLCGVVSSTRSRPAAYPATITRPTFLGWYAPANSDVMEFEEEGRVYDPSRVSDKEDPPSAPSDADTYLPPEFISLQPFKHDTFREALFLFLSLASGFIVTIVCKWQPRLYCFITMKPVASFRDSEYILIQSHQGAFVLAKVHAVQVEHIVDQVDQGGKQCVVKEWFRWFEYRKQKYVYSEGMKCFVVSLLDVGTQCFPKQGTLTRFKHVSRDTSRNSASPTRPFIV